MELGHFPKLDIYLAQDQCKVNRNDAIGKVKSYLPPGILFTLWLAYQNRQIMKGLVIFNHSSMLSKKEQPLFPQLYRIR